jgi:hypothetical protein
MIHTIAIVLHMIIALIRDVVREEVERGNDAQIKKVRRVQRRFDAYSYGRKTGYAWDVAVPTP